MHPAQLVAQFTQKIAARMAPISLRREPNLRGMLALESALVLWEGGMRGASSGSSHTLFIFL